jgi:hypothetical protein
MDRVSIDTFRLAGVTSAALFIAYFFAWPLAYITPLFVWNYLKTGKGFGFRAGLANIAAPIGGCLLGMLTSLAIQYHPLLFLLATALLLWLVFYLNAGTFPFDIGVWLTIGLTLVPMLTMQDAGVAITVIKGLLTSAVVAVIFAWIGYLLIPVGPEAEPVGQDVPEAPTEHERLKSATLSLAVVLPVVIFFYSLNLAGQLLIMIFIAIMAQIVSLDNSGKIGFALLASNVIGGLAAILIYNFLVMVPEFIFMLIVLLTAAMVFAALNFSSHKIAPLFGMGFTTTLLIIGGATMPFSDGAQIAVITRIVSILVVVLYFVVVLAMYRAVVAPDPRAAGSEQA